MRRETPILLASAPQMVANGHGNPEGIDMDRNGKTDGLQDVNGMGTNAVDNIHVDSPVKRAAKQLDETLDMLTIDPKEIVRVSLERVAAMHYPSPARAAQAALTIQSAEAPIRDLLYQWNLVGLRKTLWELERDCRILAQPLPIISFSENLAGHFEAMNRLGWSSLEIERVKLFSDPNSQDRVLSYTINDITLASRLVTRVQIRELGPGWQPDSEWRSTSEFLAMERAHQDAIAAEQARKGEHLLRYSNGPLRLIGKVVPA